MARTVDIVVMHTNGCAATPPTVHLIHHLVADMGLDAEVTMLLVETQEQAQDLRFLGSPTVLVGGVDVDPAARDARHFGLG